MSLQKSYGSRESFTGKRQSLLNDDAPASAGCEGVEISAPDGNRSQSSKRTLATVRYLALDEHAVVFNECRHTCVARGVNGQWNWMKNTRSHSVNQSNVRVLQRVVTKSAI
ncbi:MAG: hypothetical protein ABI625_07290 [bacterium]